MEAPKVTRTVVQNQVQPFEVVKPKFVQKNVQKQIFQDEIRHAPEGTEESVDVLERAERRIEIPQVQLGDQMGEAPIQVQFQVPMVKKGQMMVEVSQAEPAEQVVRVPLSGAAEDGTLAQQDVAELEVRRRWADLGPFSDEEEAERKADVQQAQQPPPAGERRRRGRRR